MSIFILTTALFFSASAVFIPLFLIVKEKYKNIKIELKKSKDDFNILTDKLNMLKDELSTKRNGFFSETITLLSKEEKADGKTGDPYNFIIYIKELDRFTNGMSKIQLTDIELISGYDNYQYEWAKQCIKDKFSSLKKTSEIDWLESEESIKDMRKQKLKNLDILNDVK